VTSRALSVIVHAFSKVGKSTLGNSTPPPRLLLDAEAAYRFLPGLKVFWDPMAEAPPIPGQGRIDPSDPTVYLIDWETCVVIVRSYPILVRSYDWLNSGQHPFVSVTIDSISEIQTKCKDDLTADGRMTQQLWGDLLTHMDRLVRGFRDLTEHPTRPLTAVVLTAMTQMKDGKYKPYVQGQLQVKMPYFLDVIGYLFVQEIAGADPTQPITKVRRMLVSPSAQYEAGERVQGKLGDIVENPTIVGMLDMVFGPVQKEGQQ
jgi:AAA domain